MPSSSTLLHLVAAWDKYCTSLCVPPKWWSSQQLYKSFQFLIWAYPNPFHLTFFAILPSLHILIVFTLNSFKPRTCLMWGKNTTQRQWTTYKKNFFEWAIPGLFFFIFSFSIQLTFLYIFLPMTGFKPRTSGDWSNHSANCATTTALYLNLFMILFFYLCSPFSLFISEDKEADRFVPTFPPFVNVWLGDRFDLKCFALKRLALLVIPSDSYTQLSSFYYKLTHRDF